MTTKEQSLTELTTVVDSINKLYDHLNDIALVALELGATYQEVGDALGVSRQAAWSFYGPVKGTGQRLQGERLF